MTLLGVVMDWMFRKLISKKTIAMALIFMVIALLSVGNGIDDFKRSQEAKDEFVKLNDIIFNSITNYIAYGWMGVSVCFNPSPTEIFFPKGATSSDCFLKADSMWNSDVFLNAQGMAAFSEDQATAFRFSNVILYPGVFLVLLLGFSVFRDVDKTRSAAGVVSPRKFYFSVAISSLLLIAFTLAVLIALMIGYVKLNGISFGTVEISGMVSYYVRALTMLTASFFAGVSTGYIRRNTTAYTTVVVVWFVIAFVFPGVVKHMVSKRAESLAPIFKITASKATIAHDFEAWAEKNYGEFDRNNIETERKLIETFWNLYFKDMMRIDDEYSKELEGVIEFNRVLSGLTPSSHYTYSGMEISGSGYENLLRLMGHLKKLKSAFMRFWIDQVYYRDHKVVKDFFETHPEIEIFNAKPVVPAHFMSGELIGIAWCFVLMAIGYFLFNRRIYHNAGSKETACESVDVFLTWGGLYVFHSHDRDFPGIITNLFFGKPGKFNGKFVVEDTNLVNNKMKSFLYLPSIDRMQSEEKAGDYLRYILKLCGLKKDAIQKVKAEFSEEVLSKPLPELESIWKFRLMMAVAYHVERDVYLFRDISNGLNLKKIEKSDIARVDSIIDRDSIVIDLYLDDDGNSWYYGKKVQCWRDIYYKDGEYRVTAIEKQ